MHTLELEKLEVMYEDCGTGFICLPSKSRFSAQTCQDEECRHTLVGILETEVLDEAAFVIELVGQKYVIFINLSKYRHGKHLKYLLELIDLVEVFFDEARLLAELNGKRKEPSATKPTLEIRGVKGPRCLGG